MPRPLRPTALLLIALLLACAAADARVVGLVVDDSGSMSRSYQKALFAAQLLVAAMHEDDGVFVARLNGGDGAVEVIGEGARAQFLARMQRDWPEDWQSNGETPFAPVLGMLERLVADTAADEDAALLLFTDGNFSGLPADLAGALDGLKSRLRGRSLAVRFVSLPGEPPDARMRATLLGVFNGAPDAGASTIETADQVVPGLRAVITELAGGDPADAGAFIARAGREVRFRLPFGVTGLVLLAAGDSTQAPAGVVDTSFALAADPLLLEPAMTRPDRGEQLRLRARATHLRPKPALAAGETHRLTLDRPLGPQDRLLFEGDLRIALRVVGADGAPLSRDPLGRLRIPEGQGLRVHARFEDRIDGGWQPLDLEPYGVRPSFRLNDGLSARPMTVDAVGEADAEAGPYARPDQYTLSVEGRISGLKYQRSDDLILQVVPIADVRPRLSGAHALPCPDCAPGDIDLPYLPGADGSVAYRIQARVDDAPTAADYALRLDGPLPAGVTLRSADAVLPADADDRTLALHIGPGAPDEVLLHYDNGYQTTAPSTVTLRLTPADPTLRGSATLALTLRPVVAPLVLRADGHSLADQDQPFSLPVTEVGDGDGVFIAAEGLRRPLHPAQLRLESPGPVPLALEIVGDQRLIIRPQLRWWSDCLTPTGPRTYRITYDNPATRQRASFEGRLTVTDLPWWRKCLVEALLALALLLALIKLICWLRSGRFPPHSRLYRFDMDRDVPPQRRDLHRPIAAFFACRDARHKVLGLSLVVRGGRVEILPDAAIPPGLYHSATSELLATTFERNRGRSIGWRFHDELRDDQARYRYLLIRDHRRFDEAAFRRDWG